LPAAGFVSVSYTPRPTAHKLQMCISHQPKPWQSKATRIPGRYWVRSANYLMTAEEIDILFSSASIPISALNVRTGTHSLTAERITLPS